jgi:hypothetical protein
VYVDQNWVERKSPPYVSAQHESTVLGLAALEQDRTASELAVGMKYQQLLITVALDAKCSLN